MSCPDAQTDRSAACQFTNDREPRSCADVQRCADRVGRVQAVLHNPAQAWYFASKMGPGEAYIWVGVLCFGASRSEYILLC